MGKEALALYRTMRAPSLVPDLMTTVYCIEALGSSNMWKEMEELRHVIEGDAAIREKYDEMVSKQTWTGGALVSAARQSAILTPKRSGTFDESESGFPGKSNSGFPGKSNTQSSFASRDMSQARMSAGAA